MAIKRVKLAVLWSLLLCLFRVKAEHHSLVGTYTAVYTDEFTCVLWLDGEAVDSCSSNGMVSVAHRNWTREGQGYYVWKDIKRANIDQWDRGRADILKYHTGLTMSGVAVVQGRFGCEIELNTGSTVRVTGTYAQYGWNGEDFLSFNLTREQWVASAESAVFIIQTWNRDQAITMETKKYIEEICVSDLLQIVYFEAKESHKTSLPSPEVFVKKSSHTGKVILTCLASGFCCSGTRLEVYRDNDTLTEKDGLLSSGIRPNGDGTYQLRESLDITSSTAASYTCEVHFGSLMKRVKWDGEKQDLDEPSHHYWLLIILFGGFFIIITVLILRRRRCTQANCLGMLQQYVDAPRGPRWNETELSGFDTLMPQKTREE